MSRLAVGYLVFVVGLLVLVVGSHLISDEHIADQLIEARDAGEFSRDNWVLTRPGNLEDKFADCFGTSQGLGYDGLFDSALRSPNLGPCPDANEKLDLYQATGDLSSSWDYFRYWHGYTTISRPSIAALGVKGTRYLLTLLIGATLIGGAAMAVRRTRNLAALALFAPLAATTDLLWMASSIPTAIGVIAALCGPLLVFAAPPPHDEADALRDLALMKRLFVAGGIVAFFDLLSVGPISWAFTVAAVVVSLPTVDITNRRAVALTVSAAGSWILGYGATWASKWFFTSFVVGVEDTWESVRSGVGFRLGGEHQLVESGFAVSSRENLDYWLQQPYAKVTLALTVGIVAGRAFVYREQASQWLKQFALLGAPALLIVVWYEVLRNHSQIHHWLTYRFWAVFAGILIYAALRSGHDLTLAPHVEQAPTDSAGDAAPAARHSRDSLAEDAT